MNKSIKLDKLDDSTINSFRMTMDPNAIPDMDKMYETLYDLINFVESEPMKKLEEENFEEFENILYGRYNSLLPMKVISLMTEGDRYDHIDNLMNMFDSLAEIKQGNRDIQDEFKKFNENLNQKYLYDPFGGKENFEKLVTAEKGKSKKKKRKHKSKKIESNVIQETPQTV